ncbi:alpha/beta hydrolase [Lysinibacillus pakistanensis]|uniref:Alpha/beta hydrolase n=1 Tax=Lysinibacillus pakistanensis TaxID=759811 RepID=A0AAX3WNV2_9BACI|nr:alpha/beta hydrolase [Lysinibacillus pakistanensis]MDM5233888.1 alpha/beta hydrolase [Lysinibacillus pakistanensis]WHY44500.1 alpha/beta hydrolase [Lysinibacillus pakistanensis]WHY49508.1 alpha/beta hydrolase [Lysinibacillus pakistanensis]
MNNINREGFDLAYCVKGQGEKKIVVIGSSVYYPRLFSENLYKHFQFYFLDHRGFVKSPRELKQEDYTLDKIVEDIEAARQFLKLENFIILGHSGHAFMALAYAKKYPQYIDKVILLNSAPTNSQERQQQSFSYFNETADTERKRQFEHDIAFLENDIRNDPERRFVHMCLRMGAHSFYDYTFDAADMWEGVYTNMQIIDYLWGVAFAERDLIHLLADVEKPVLVGLGRYDYLVAPVSLWDSLDGLDKNVKKVIFEKSGHNPMYEEPETFDRELISWINNK